MQGLKPFVTSLNQLLAVKVRKFQTTFNCICRRGDKVRILQSRIIILLLLYPEPEVMRQSGQLDHGILELCFR